MILSFVQFVLKVIQIYFSPLGCNVFLKKKVGSDLNSFILIFQKKYFLNQKQRKGCLWFNLIANSISLYANLPKSYWATSLWWRLFLGGMNEKHQESMPSIYILSGVTHGVTVIPDAQEKQAGAIQRNAIDKWSLW